MRSPAPPSALARPVVIALTVAVASLLSGCGGDSDPPEAQPAPGVSTFVAGRFDDLPLHPRSDPVGRRSETDGVITRSFATRGITTEGVLEFYADVLPDRGWTPVGQVEATGPAAHQGDWASEGWQLRVSAIDATNLNVDGEGSDDVVTQYSLVLTPP